MGSHADLDAPSLALIARAGGAAFSAFTGKGTGRAQKEIKYTHPKINLSSACIDGAMAAWKDHVDVARRNATASSAALLQHFDSLARQLRHHFGPYFARFSASPHPTRAV